MTQVRIPEKWSFLQSTIDTENDNIDNFIVSDVSSGIWPDSNNIFNALNDMDPKQVRYVVLGQDPYPRPVSATGISFFDGEVLDWQGKMSPSIRNIIKSILISRDLCEPDTKVAQMRQTISSINFPQPQEFFDRTRKNGTLWLNTSLTFGGKAAKTLREHLNFWKPTINTIIEHVIAESEHTVAFLLFGGKAQKLEKSIQKKADKAGKQIVFVRNCHPMMQAFHDECCFLEIPEFVDIVFNETENKKRTLGGEKGSKIHPLLDDLEFQDPKAEE
ncbi:hypothetical protein PCE1_000156 [Barthelona sp. PCE]